MEPVISVGLNKPGNSGIGNRPSALNYHFIYFTVRHEIDHRSDTPRSRSLEDDITYSENRGM